MAQSRIEWTETTWNPVTGCTKISPGCKNCYAERMAKRLKAMRQPNYQNAFAVRCHPHMLERPLEWKKPRMVFVNSMSDLFHEKVPLSFIKDVFATMRQPSRHTFQVLTKRADRLAELSRVTDLESGGVKPFTGMSCIVTDNHRRTRAQEGYPCFAIDAGAVRESFAR